MAWSEWLNVADNQGELLWTNSNPSAAFAAQDITIPANGADVYKSIIVIFNWSTAFPARQCVYLDTSMKDAWVHYAGKTRYVKFDYYSKVHFDADNGDNTGLIPYKIIGFKDLLVN